VIEIVLLRRTPEQEGIARLEERTGARLGIRQVLFLKFWKALRFKYSDSAFVPHIIFPSSLTS